MEDSIFTIYSQEKISKDSSINLKSSIKDSAFLFSVMKYRNYCKISPKSDLFPFYPFSSWITSAYDYNQDG